jgi:hypothetical protein
MSDRLIYPLIFFTHAEPSTALHSGCGPIIRTKMLAS